MKIKYQKNTQEVSIVATTASERKILSSLATKLERARVNNLHYKDDKFKPRERTFELLLPVQTS